ncbi:hypothetical protein VTJ83DRAFT_5205 [Remersonia thermophila]|uniref:Uncharacterized protein n=1 Tax=Remersonia thermophila TaxID=72144 RepID=A0ABR4DC77_9PEZI
MGEGNTTPTYTQPTQPPPPPPPTTTTPSTCAALIASAVTSPAPPDKQPLEAHRHWRWRQMTRRREGGEAAAAGWHG